MESELPIKFESTAFMIRRGQGDGGPHSIVSGIAIRDHDIQAVNRAAKEHHDQALRSAIRVLCGPSARTDPDEGQSAKSGCRIQKIAPTHMVLRTSNA